MPFKLRPVRTHRRWSNKKIITLGVIAVALACKVPGKKGGASGLESSLDKEAQLRIAEQVKSFNDTQQELIAANKRGDGACAKLDILWNKIVDTKQPDDQLLPPDAVMKEVLTFGNGSANRYWRAFTGWKDEEGGSDIRPYEEKTKNFIRLTHRYGVLAKMKFVVNKDAVAALGYTGHYRDGSDCVLGRLSSAVPTSKADRFTPAFAAKFFVGGNQDNQVLITQHDIGGQSSGTDYTVDPPREKTLDNNFYTHYLSNRLSFEKGVYSGVGAFSRFFYSAQYIARNLLHLNYIVDPRELQATHLAERNAAGTVIAPDAAKGPRFVWTMAPSDSMKSEFGTMASKDSDFRKHFLSLNERMKDGANVVVFNVYASDNWTYNPEKEATLIGQFVTQSPFVVSEAADVRLFFKHSIQFRHIPDAEGKANPYTQDISFNEWNDKLFTSDCRLGVREAEVVPSSPTALDGTFIRDATVNPKTLRRDAKGNICIKNIILDKLEESISPWLQGL